MKSLQLTISDAMAEKLKNKAEEMKTDVNQLINISLEKFFFFQQINNIRNDLRENVKSEQWKSEEDVFNDIS